jgi:N-acetylmuramoyl-L-alanine amidase
MTTMTDDRPVHLPDEAGLDIAARTAIGEARGEGSVGMAAVLWTIRNRVHANAWWGRSYIAVCLWPLQYSCWNDRDPNRKLILSLTVTDPSYRQARELARDVFIGKIADPTGGATHYLNPAVVRPLPNWAAPERKTCVIGAHHFYRLEA